MKYELILRITDYLSKGGLFNPESMDHEQVQRLLIDIRDYLLDEADKTPNRYPSMPPITPLPYPLPNTQPSWYGNCPKCGLKLEGTMGYVCPNAECPTGLGGVWCKNDK